MDKAKKDVRRLEHLHNQEYYSSWKIQGPDGKFLSYCPEKRVRWYLKRDLVEVIDNTTIRLKFEPDGPIADQSLQIKKENHCVVCGAKSELTRHHVVPYGYLRFYPDYIKSRNSYDVFLLCEEHHAYYELKAITLKKELGIKFNAPLDGMIDSDRNNVRLRADIKGHINTLQGHYDKIPETKRQKMIAVIKRGISEYTGIDCGKMTLEEIAEIEIDRVQPSLSHGEIIAKNYDPDDLAILWRRHFIETMKPKFMPEDWKIDRRIFQERRKLKK